MLVIITGLFVEFFSSLSRVCLFTKLQFETLLETTPQDDNF